MVDGAVLRRSLRPEIDADLGNGLMLRAGREIHLGGHLGPELDHHLSDNQVNLNYVFRAGPSLLGHVASGGCDRRLSAVPIPDVALAADVWLPVLRLRVQTGGPHWQHTSAASATAELPTGENRTRRWGVRRWAAGPVAAGGFRMPAGGVLVRGYAGWLEDRRCGCAAPHLRNTWRTASMPKRAAASWVHTGSAPLGTRMMS